MSCSGWMPVASSGRNRSTCTGQAWHSNRKQATFVSLAAPVPAGFRRGYRLGSARSGVLGCGELLGETRQGSGRRVARLADGRRHRRCPCLAMLPSAVQVRAAMDTGVGRAGLALWPAGLLRLFGASPVADVLALSQLRSARAARSPGLFPCHRDFPAPAPNGTEVFAENISVL